jgi:hypothetical protein
MGVNPGVVDSAGAVTDAARDGEAGFESFVELLLGLGSFD